MWGLTTLARPTKTPPTFPSSCRPSREPFIHITFGYAHIHSEVSKTKSRVESVGSGRLMLRQTNKQTNAQNCTFI